MTKKDKILCIITLILLIVVLIIFPLSVILFYFFVIIPEIGFSYFRLISIVLLSLVVALLSWHMTGKEILQIFTLLLSEKIKEMEKDDGREESN